MRLQSKSISRVTLVNLLRRKRTSLKKFVTDNGIFTYELLVNRCNSMGVVPPAREDFEDAVGPDAKYQASSPTEGIVVLYPPNIDEEVSPAIENTSSTEAQSTNETFEDSPSTSKKKKKS